jgi:hypothetical protein
VEQDQERLERERLEQQAELERRANMEHRWQFGWEPYR